MKNYYAGIVLGGISILCALLFVGIPIGFNNILETITTLSGVVGLLAVLCLGISGKNDKITVISTAMYVVVLFVLILIVELNYNDFVLTGTGFLPGLSVSIMGIIKTVKVKGKSKTTASFILNITGLVFSIANLLLTILSGGFIIQ